MKYIFAIIIGYLLGCSHMSYYISKFQKVDIKSQGSKNYGAANTAQQLGLKAGILVFVHDFIKAFFAVIITEILFKDVKCGVIAGCASVIGHIFPFYLTFDGGKGYASFIGMSIALYPLFGTIAFLLSVIIALLLDYVVASTFSFIVAIPAFALFNGDCIDAIIIFTITLLVVWKHKGNIKNLTTKNGKETKISEVIKKKSNKSSGRDY